MHRRKDLYGDDAEEFRPERWEGDGLRNIGWGYLPFNGGPRICLGRKYLFVRDPLTYSSLTPSDLTEDFALLEASYTIARLVQPFPVIKPAPGEELVKIGEERQNLTLVVS